LQALGNFPAQGLIKQWLKAGYVEDARRHPTDTGVPQGGVTTPPTTLQTFFESIV
jgi:RNA-directed DNA polymerase